jgi:ParB/RepB/Spo0J family partition protein
VATKKKSDAVKGSSIPKLGPCMAVEIDMVDCHLIDPSLTNPRNDGQDGIDELLASIKANGLLQPIVIREKADGRYEIIAGERRWRACRQIWTTIPAIIRDSNDREAHVATVVENLQRRDLDPLSEAGGIKTLQAMGQTIPEIAEQIGRSVKWVAMRAKLADLAPVWREAHDNPESGISKWSATALEKIARLDEAVQVQLLSVFDDSWNDWTIADIESELSKMMRAISSAPWNIEDAGLVPKAGSCANCQKRSSCAPNLFDDLSAADDAKGDRCLDPECWKSKSDAHLDRAVTEATESYPDLVLVKSDQFDPANDSDNPIIKKALNHWSVTATKKATEGARRAMVVTGPKAGTMMWVVSNEKNKALPASASADGKADMKAKREALEKRRRIAYIKHAMELMDDFDNFAEVTDDNLVFAIAVFGANAEANSYDSYATWKKFDRLAEGEYKDAFKVAAIAIMRVWHRDLQQHTYVDGIDGVKYADRVLRFLSKDADAERAGVWEKIKEPKSWQKEE